MGPGHRVLGQHHRKDVPARDRGGSGRGTPQGTQPEITTPQTAAVGAEIRALSQGTHRLSPVRCNQHQASAKPTRKRGCDATHTEDHQPHVGPQPVGPQRPRSGDPDDPASADRRGIPASLRRRCLRLRVVRHGERDQAQHLDAGSDRGGEDHRGTGLRRRAWRPFRRRRNAGRIRLRNRRRVNPRRREDRAAPVQEGRTDSGNPRTVGDADRRVQLRTAPVHRRIPWLPRRTPESLCP